MAGEEYKYICTKHRVYRLPADAKGIPIEEVYPGAQTPAFLKGAVVYDTPRGRIIAHREPAERGGDGKGGDAAQERRHAIGKDAAEARPTAAAERCEALPTLKEPPPGRRDNPMRFFRKDVPARSAAADPWQAVKINCQEDFFVRPERNGIEDAAAAAREVRVLLTRHFPEGPAIAARSLKAARRWNSSADRAFAEGTEDAQPLRSGQPLVGFLPGLCVLAEASPGGRPRARRLQPVRRHRFFRLPAREAGRVPSAHPGAGWIRAMTTAGARGQENNER